MMEFSPMTRTNDVKRLQSQPFDVVVIGGGITGAGVAREAALRGYKVGLVEKNDFASGTSGKSARMVHGGLRYLEQYQFGLVLSACTERYRLYKMAPRLVHPTPFTYPIYRNSRNSLGKLRLGMILYDLLALFRNFRPHRILKPQEVATLEPALMRTGLAGAAFYYDCIEDDARLTLTTIQSAAQCGAVIANHVKVIHLLITNERVSGFKALDELDGTQFDVHAKVIVNATGVWTDQIRRLDDQNAKEMVRGNRGTHVVFPWDKLPVTGAVAFSSSDGKRAMYALRWQNTTIAGTTDVNHVGSLDQVYATADEVMPILDAINHAFSPIKLTPADILSTYAGLRPLISDEGKNEGKAAYQVSRDHQIIESHSGLVSIAGGKLTTFRKMGEDLMDYVAKKLAGEYNFPAQRKIRSERVPLVDVKFDLASAVKQWSFQFQNLSKDILSHLGASYGAAASHVLDFISESPHLSERIVASLPYIFAEVPYAVRFEMALTLSDFLVRRTHIIYEAPDQGIGGASKVAETMASYVGWGADQMAEQINAYHREVELTRHYIEELQKPSEK